MYLWNKALADNIELVGQREQRRDILQKQLSFPDQSSPNRLFRSTSVAEEKNL